MWRDKGSTPWSSIREVRFESEAREDSLGVSSFESDLTRVDEEAVSGRGEVGGLITIIKSTLRP
jgi:hypothetical protein